MDTYPAEFYNPLAIALNGRKLQEFVDRILDQYNRLDIAGFEWDNDLLPDFTYSQVQRELNIDVMASYVDLDSDPIPVATEGDTLSTGRIPRMKAVEYYNEDKLRKLYQRENRRDVTRQDIIDAAGIGVGEIFAKLVSRHSNSISYQRDQVVSAGKFVITNTNNPNGIQNVTFANHIPAANINTISTSSKKWWTNSAHSSEGSDADPIKDLKDLVKKGTDRHFVGHIEINKSFFDEVINHSKVKSAIAAALFPLGDSTQTAAAVAVMGRAAKQAALEAILDCKIVLRDGQARVEKWDSSTAKLAYQQFESFEKNVVVFVPDGNIGRILTVEPILLTGGEYAFAFDGKLAITIDKDYKRKCMSYNSEMTSLVVPETPQLMFYLKPCEN